MKSLEFNIVETNRSKNINDRSKNINDWLSDSEYKALSNLYNEFHSAFIMLPDYIVKAYFARLLSK